MRARPALLNLLLSCFLLAGCQSVPAYRQPSDSNVASISGSGNQHREGLFRGLWRGSVIVFLVDGALVSGDPNSYRQPVIVAAGPRQIEIAVERRLKDSHDRPVVEVGYRTVSLDMPAGAAYRVCMRPTRGVMADPYYVTIWIEDSAGRRVGNFMNIQLIRKSFNAGLGGINDEGLMTTC